MTVTVNTGNVQRVPGTEARAEPSTWSIDELASLVGVPSRTIREYRTIGVLAPPRKVGRVGRYDEAHRRRLELIAQLQERGYSLAAIRDLVSAHAEGRSLDDVLGRNRPAFDESPMMLTTAELIERVPALSTVSAQRAAVTAGLLMARGSGEWVVRSASLLALVGDVTGEGVVLEVVLDVVVSLRDAAHVQAQAVITLFGDHVWPELDADRAVGVARRARLLVAQSAASLVVDEMANSLRRHAANTGDDGLGQLVDQLSIGAVRTAERMDERGS